MHHGPARPSGPSLGEAEKRYERGSKVEATVTSLFDDGSRAWLSLPDGAEATVVKQAVGTSGVLSLASVLAVGAEVIATVVGVGMHRDKVQVQVSLPDLTVPPVAEQLAALGIAPGYRLSGRLNHVNPSLGLFIEVAPKVNGLAHLSGLPGGTVDGFEVGELLDIEILKVAENPRKPGSANVGLRLTG